MTKTLKKVRVTYKNPIGRKTATIYMSDEAIEWSNSKKGFSPYSKIVILKKK